MLSQYSLCGAPPTATRPGAASLPGRCPTVPRPGSLGLSGAAHLARTQTSSLHAQIVNSCRRAAWSAGRGLPERLCPSATPIHGLGRSRGQATRSSAFRGNRAGPGGFNANGGYGTGAAGMGPEELNGRFQQMEQQVRGMLVGGGGRAHTPWLALDFAPPCKTFSLQLPGTSARLLPDCKRPLTVQGPWTHTAATLA